MTKVKKFNLKNSAIATRSDAYSVKVEDINVNFEDNPRVDYGDNDGNEDFQELKNSIKENGLLVPISVYVHPVEGTLHLSHGFRRMRAILELNQEGQKFEKVRVQEVEYNEETILLQHFILNTGKQLTDFELGETLLKLSILMGEDNLTILSKRSGIDYNKVVRLIGFAKKGGTQLKEKVKTNKISISNAISLANATDVKGQNKAIAEAEEKVGDKKITVKELTILQAPATTEESSSPKTSTSYGKLRSYIQLVKSTDNDELDNDFTSRLEALLNDMDAKDLTDKQIIGKHFAKTVEA